MLHGVGFFCSKRQACTGQYLPRMPVAPTCLPPPPDPSKHDDLDGPGIRVPCVRGMHPGVTASYGPVSAYHAAIPSPYIQRDNAIFAESEAEDGPIREQRPLVEGHQHACVGVRLTSRYCRQVRKGPCREPGTEGGDPPRTVAPVISPQENSTS